jgi:hypothetical protein
VRRDRQFSKKLESADFGWNAFCFSCKVVRTCSVGALRTPDTKPFLTVVLLGKHQCRMSYKTVVFGPRAVTTGAPARRPFIFRMQSPLGRLRQTLPGDYRVNLQTKRGLVCMKFQLAERGQENPESPLPFFIKVLANTICIFPDFTAQARKGGQAHPRTLLVL